MIPPLEFLRSIAVSAALTQIRLSRTTPPSLIPRHKSSLIKPLPRPSTRFPPIKHFSTVPGVVCHVAATAALFPVFSNALSEQALTTRRDLPPQTGRPTLSLDIPSTFVGPENPSCLKPRFADLVTPPHESLYSDGLPPRLMVTKNQTSRTLLRPVELTPIVRFPAGHSFERTYPARSTLSLPSCRPPLPTTPQKLAKVQSPYASFKIFLLCCLRSPFPSRVGGSTPLHSSALTQLAPFNCIHQRSAPRFFPRLQSQLPPTNPLVPPLCYLSPLSASSARRPDCSLGAAPPPRKFPCVVVSFSLTGSATRTPFSARQVPLGSLRFPPLPSPTSPQGHSEPLTSFSHDGRPLRLTNMSIFSSAPPLSLLSLSSFLKNPGTGFFGGGPF